MRKTFRDSEPVGEVGADIIGRLGGDEFAVLTTQNERLADASVIGRRLDEQIRRWNETSREEYTISMSYGIVTYSPQNPTSLHDLIKQADALMYENKMRRKEHRENR